MAPFRRQTRALCARHLGPGRRLRPDRTQRPDLVRVSLSPMAQEQFFEVREDRTAALAREIAARLAAGVTAQGAASLIVAGGSTPGPLLDALAQAPAAWDKTSVTLTDER